MAYPSVNRFRTRRGRLLRRQIEALAAHLGRDITVLDVGGRPDYWQNVGLGGIARIEVMNRDPGELALAFPGDAPAGMFVQTLGDARDLAAYPDGSIDLVHSNSVIEHVGGWADMRAMADELMRVGRSGWVQTPAWEFPIEPHFRAPFLHWFGRPLQARLMSLSFERRNRRQPLDHRRRRTESINLLSRHELGELFPDRAIFTERLALLPKSYVVRWMPEGVPLDGAPASLPAERRDGPPPVRADEVPVPARVPAPAAAVAALAGTRQDPGRAPAARGADREPAEAVLEVAGERQGSA